MAARRDDHLDPGDASSRDDDVVQQRGRRGPSARVRRRRTMLVVLATVIVAAAVGAVVWASSQPREVIPMVAPTTSTPTQSPTPIDTPLPIPSDAPTLEVTATPEPSPTPAGNLAIAGDIASASSLTVLVNKLTPLNPLDYEPDDLVAMADIGVPSQNNHSLRAAAANAVQTMFAAAEADGISLDMTSGYRSSALQAQLYDGYVATLGQEGADATSARPGFSEHQTGLAADISAPAAGCTLEQCFASTVEGQWLAANAWQFGFILRYPDGATPMTGYEFEPWHYRYVGVDVATAMHGQGIATYEEFLGQPAAPGYAD